MVPVTPTTTTLWVASTVPTTARTTPRSKVLHPLPPVAFVARYPVRVMDRAPARVDRSVAGVSGAALNAAVLTAALPWLRFGRTPPCASG